MATLEAPIASGKLPCLEVEDTWPLVRDPARTVTMRPSGIGAALGVALCISLYSVIDGAAVQLMPAGAYTALVFGLTAAMVTPAVLARYGCRFTVAVWQAHWRKTCAVGIMMLLAYILVLQAYAIARVSYVGALREIRVVLAALAGWLWLKEGFGVMRTVGAGLIFLGMLLIALVGD
jgi:drug/metabolite transporter (DMT)-like permease